MSLCAVQEQIEVRTRIKPGEEGVARMPFSEVCCHMGIAGKIMRFRLVPTRYYRAMVQLLCPETGNDWGGMVLKGEAGVYENPDGSFYYYKPADGGAQ